jgi:5-methyltetrahydropteroyltriglutamate--homocysteine methyltransferase
MAIQDAHDPGTAATTAMSIASNLGFPRLGARRELKTALEGYWSGEIGRQDLLSTGRAIRREHWLLQSAAGIEHVPSNDFSFYDHVLDMALIAGAVPKRYRCAGPAPIDISFAMARGITSTGRRAVPGGDVAALGMTKWFDTNYHYIVPEFDRSQTFRIESTKPVDEFVEARSLGIQTRPVLLGPVSFLLLGRRADGRAGPIGLIDGIVPVYESLLARLAGAGAAWVQLDEPCLVLDLPPEVLGAMDAAYRRLARAAPALRLLLATYFGGLRANLGAALRMPVSALHLDLVRDPGQLERALAEAPASLSLSLGVVDGRNVWRADLDGALRTLERAAERLGADRVLVAPSCSLLHCPLDLDLETRLEPELESWLAFSKQKLHEVRTLVRALRHGRAAVRAELAASREAARARRTSPRIRDAAVRTRCAGLRPSLFRRSSARGTRRPRQREALALPLFPTTTIGSFPQTAAVRTARARFRSGRSGPGEYEAFLRGEIERAIRFQEAVGLDVLVHGEFERSDMVEYFAERLQGFGLTREGWVQSYGSRSVKPPILYGDVCRRGPMTVEWSRYAQSLTARPVKGMLTGPVTMLQWSFVRDDQPRASTCRQIALALRDEIADLEAAGIRIIQIDEPALREGLPPGSEARTHYLGWAVAAFRLASSGVRETTQIHTHMCYSDFADIIESIADLDADVLAIEGARSGMRIAEALKRLREPIDVGPGVYDIHSPRVPSADEIEARLRQAQEVVPPDRLWVNPDCGLKTRGWDEVRPALTAMVAAARRLRAAPDRGSARRSDRVLLTPPA